MYKVNKQGAKVEIKFDVDGNEWEQMVQKVYDMEKGKYRVEGFRKGRAPRKMIEKEYGESVFFDDTIDFIYRLAITELMRKNSDYEPMTQPELSMEAFSPKTGVKMTVTYYCLPDFTLGQYKGLKVPVHSAEVSDKEVEEHEKRFLEEHASFEDVDRPAKNGDHVLCNYVGFLNNKEFEGGSAENADIKIGAHRYIDNFEEQLISHKAGEVVDVNVKFPDDYPAEELKGQKANFKVTILKVREEKLPKMDDKFISNATEFETVEEYRKDLTAHIQSMKQRSQDMEFQNKLVDMLIENSNIDIPDEMVHSFAHREIDKLTQSLAQLNMSIEDYCRYQGYHNFQEFHDGMVERMKNGIKMRHIYARIAETEHLDPTDEEIEQATKDLTEDKKGSVISEMRIDRIRKFLEKNNEKEILKEE